MKVICPYCKHANDDEVDLDNLIPALKRLRLSKKLTLREVEKLTGISNSTISQIETRKIKKPSFEHVAKLLKAYRIKIEVVE